MASQPAADTASGLKGTGRFNTTVKPARLTAANTTPLGPSRRPSAAPSTSHQHTPESEPTSASDTPKAYREDRQLVGNAYNLVASALDGI